MNQPEPIWQIIINPAAAGVGKALLEKLEKSLPGLIPNARIHYTTGTGVAIDIASKCMASGTDHFVVVGGDGTLNEVVNGIFQNGIPEQTPVVAILPAGSGNDWAKSLGFTPRLEELFGRLQSGNFSSVNIGRMEYVGSQGTVSRYFANVAGLAFDAAVAQKVHGKKYLFPRWLYLYEALKGLFLYKAGVSTIVYDEKYFEGRAFTINVGLQPFSGGGMQLVPHAREAGDKMALTVLEPRPGIQLLFQILRLYSGSIGKLPYAHLHHASRIKIVHREEAIPLEADGEFLGHTPASFEIIPAAIRVPQLS